MYISRFATDMREAKWNFYKYGVQETWIAQITPWITREVHLETRSEPERQYAMQKHGGQKSKPNRSFYEIIRKFPGLFVCSGVWVILCLGASNVRIAAAKLVLSTKADVRMSGSVFSFKSGFRTGSKIKIKLEISLRAWGDSGIALLSLGS